MNPTILKPIRESWILKFKKGQRAGMVWGPSETQTSLLINTHALDIDPQEYELEKLEEEPLF